MHELGGLNYKTGSLRNNRKNPGAEKKTHDGLNLGQAQQVKKIRGGGAWGLLTLGLAR